MNEAATLHATAVLVGEAALLIRGAPDSGKSFLALDLIRQAERSQHHCVRLIADDRMQVETVSGALVVSAPQKLSGLIELRYQGLLTMPYESRAIAGAVLDLEESAARLPEDNDTLCKISGVMLTRFSRLPRTPLSLGEALFMTMRCGSIY